MNGNPLTSNQRTTGGSRQVPDWLEKLARIGFLTKGVVYLILGILTASAAFGQGGQVTGSKGAIREIASQPFGNFLLYLVAFGLLAYAAWRFISAARDPEGAGSDGKGMAKRFGYALSGIAYVGLSIAAFQMAIGGGGGGSGRKVWISQLIQSGDAGRYFVGFLGLFVAVVALKQFKRAISADFVKQLRMGSMKQKLRDAVCTMGRAGFAARGVVLGIIGYMLARAAFFYDPSQAVGSGGALRMLSGMGGTIVMGIVAAGLAAYGAYMVVASRYRAVPARS